jgi:outer membrane protein assembly factor BamB
MSIFLTRTSGGRRVAIAVTILLVTASAALLVLRAGFLRGRLATPLEAIALDTTSTLPLQPVEDWPKWRGPRGDGISRESAGDAWPAEGLRRLWSWKVGIGYASPVAVNGRVYLFSLVDGKDTLSCFDARTGAAVWTDQAASGHDSDYAGTRATPTIDGDSVYTYGGDGELVRRTLADGKAVWRLQVLQAVNAKANQWGTASSPLVARGKVYVQTGSGSCVAAAVDAATGQIAWQSEARANGSYAAPLLVDVAGTPQLIVFAADAVWGINPDTGATIWREAWNTNYGVNATTPVYRDGYLMISSGYGMGSLMLKLSPTGATRHWAGPKRDIKSKFQGLVLDGDAVIGNSDPGVLTAIGWPDGERRWRAGDLPLQLKEGGSFVRAAGDKLVTFGQDGMLSLVRLKGDGPELVSQFEPFKDSGDDERRVWSTPLLYGGRVYVKGTRTFACYELPK